jgi:type IV pilus assembly protein PilQ
MPEATWQEGDGLLADPDLGIERAELSRVEEFGKRLSRLTIWLAAPAQLQLTPRADGLELEFVSFAGRPAPVVASVPEPEVPAAEDEAEIVMPSVVSASTDELVTGSNLYEVVPFGSGDGLVIELKGDGALRGRAFTLPSPERLVVDLPGVVNRVERNLYSIGSGLVRQVRVAQFQAVPEPITRLVVDLNGPAEFDVIETGSGATVSVGRVEDGAVATAAYQPVEPVSVPAAEATVDVAEIRTQPSGEVEMIGSLAEDPVETDTVVESDLFELPEEPAVDHGFREPEVETSVPETPRSPWVADSSQLIEQAPAAQVLETPARGAETFATQEVATQEQQYTGEPITLTLKDADIKDVLRTFSTLTNLNIVVDPGVSGSVTVELRNVPWDQALDLILRINSLGYTLDNNVLRIATMSRLASEKRASAELAEEAEKALPLKTVTKPLSYAKASDVAGLLAGDSYLLSDRGSVVVDERTNMLILRDTVDRVEGVLRLIDQLDLPTPQVVIEARIVETTRDFSRSLGVTWGFQGYQDAERGNTTGLRFPNSASIVGDVDLALGGNGVVAMTFSDILNTFNLDFLLSASEAAGLTKIVSTPRVTTQNLKSAQIRSGLQIPVQTVANNTVTVQYVDATLNLQVTPQITAEGTVNLQIDVKKQEPVIAFAVQGGQNAPIFTRDARTELLVRDGGTTVIAGIYQINDQESQDSVPGLHKIPVLGWLFKNREVISRHDELLIFITPRIVKY